MEYVCRSIQRHLNNLHPSIHEQPFDDYKLGLQRLLRGVTGHLRENVVSSNIAAYILATSSRFHFSHEFTHIMTRQFEDYFSGGYVRYTLGWSQQSSTGFIYSQVFDYIYRSVMLENVCLYEFMATYELIPYNENILPHQNTHSCTT